MLLSGLAALALAGWLYLLLARGGFWRCDQVLDRRTGGDGQAPEARIVAVVPARDEADVVGAAIASLLAAPLRPALQVVLADDGSRDGTAEAARETARLMGLEGRLVVLAVPERPVGWSGKVWAMANGLAVALERVPGASHVLFADADIRHDGEELADLVSFAVARRLDLASLLVRLSCHGLAERLCIPAFVFFFQKLYPFRRVNTRRAATAAAAGGCMLVSVEALRRLGGLQAIRGAAIDDVALAKAVKPDGPIWLGLAVGSESLRGYDGLGGIWRMVVRSAYVQLRRSPLLLCGTVLGMILLYLVPPVALLLAEGLARLAAAVTLVLQLIAYRPTLRLYGLPYLWGLTLPLAGLLYTLMTVDSALRHGRGRGAVWKGRLEAGVGGGQ